MAFKSSVFTRGGIAASVLFSLLSAGTSFAAAATSGPTPDGSHAFDWEIGTWKTHLRRRLHPLTGTNEWVEYDGTTLVRSVWNGRANLVELDVTGTAGHIEGLSLRLYNPEAQQWSLNYSNSAIGTMTQPVIGKFSNGRGEFYNQDTLNGRAILVRFIINESARTPLTSNRPFPMMAARPGSRTGSLRTRARRALASDRARDAYVPSDRDCGRPTRNAWT